MAPSMQDVVEGARMRLLASAQFIPLLGVDVGQDPAGKAFADAWVFKGSDNWATPERNPANSGLSTVTISMRTPWTGPNTNNTLRFPRLRFHILSDQTRYSDTDLSGSKDAEYRCDRVATAIRDTFNDVANEVHYWGNVYIVSCVLENDLAIVDVDREDGLVSGDLSFALELG